MQMQRQVLSPAELPSVANTRIARSFKRQEQSNLGISSKIKELASMSSCGFRSESRCSSSEKSESDSVRDQADDSAKMTSSLAANLG